MIQIHFGKIELFLCESAVQEIGGSTLTGPMASKRLAKQDLRCNVRKILRLLTEQEIQNQCMEDLV